MSENKPICIISTHPELESINQEHTDRGKSRKEKLKFIKKQHDDIRKESEKDHKAFWELFTSKCEGLGILPEDYNDDKHNLSIRDGVLYYSEKDEDEDMDPRSMLMHAIRNGDLHFMGPGNPFDVS